MREPTAARNLDIYGGGELPWSAVREALDAMKLPDTPQFLTTVRPDGRPHSTGIGALHHADAVYIVSGPDSLKSRNLAVNPACTLSVRLPGIDLVLEGEAHRTTDHAEIDAVTAEYRASGWPSEREGDAVTAPFSAQSAGPPPWWLYRFTPVSASALALSEPFGATSWRFA